MMIGDDDDDYDDGDGDGAIDLGNQKGGSGPNL